MDFFKVICSVLAIAVMLTILYLIKRGEKCGRRKTGKTQGSEILAIHRQLTNGSEDSKKSEVIY